MCGAHVSRVCTQVPARTLQPFAPQPGLRLLAGQDGQGARPAHEEGQAAGAPGGEAVRVPRSGVTRAPEQGKEDPGRGQPLGGPGSARGPACDWRQGQSRRVGGSLSPPSTPGPRGCTSAAGKPTGPAGAARGSLAAPGRGRPSWVGAGRGSAHPADGRSSVGVCWGALPAQVVALRPTSTRGRQHSPAAPQPHPDLAAGRGAPRPSWSPKRAVSLRAGRCPGPGPPSSSRGGPSVRGPEPPAERG